MADTFKGIITADGKKRQLPYGSVLDKPVSDETLSIPGAFADAKTVGNKFAKVNETTDSLKEDIANVGESVIKQIVEPMKELTWVNGAIYSETQQDFNSKARAISDYIHYDSSATELITIKAGYRMYVVKYIKNNEFVFVSNELIISTSVDYNYTINYEPQYYYRIQLGHRDTSIDMDLSDVTNGIVFGDATYKKQVLKTYTNEINSIGLFIKNFLTKSCKTPLITWIDDDTVRSSSKGITFVKTLADELGIKCTFACITNTISGDDVYSVATKNLLLEYQKEGFQIVSHSATHDAAWKPSSSDYSTNHIEEEITESICILKEKGFLQCDYLVTPFGAHTTEVQNIASKWCKCLINAGGAKKYNKLYGNGRYDINRVFISSVEHSNADYYTSIIDEAIINGGWIVFGTHSGMNTESGGWSAELVKKVLQYAKDKSVRIATLSEAFKIRKPIYDLYDMFN